MAPPPTARAVGQPRLIVEAAVRGLAACAQAGSWLVVVATTAAQRVQGRVIRILEPRSGLFRHSVRLAPIWSEGPPAAVLPA